MTAGVGQAPLQGFVFEEAKWEKALYRPHMLYAKAMEACKISTCPSEQVVVFSQAPQEMLQEAADESGPQNNGKTME